MMMVMRRKPCVGGKGGVRGQTPPDDSGPQPYGRYRECSSSVSKTGNPGTPVGKMMGYLHVRLLMGKTCLLVGVSVG